MTIGDYIKVLAKQKGTSAAKIERELGFANGYISTSRDSSLPYARLLQIAKCLDVSVEYLWSKGESSSNSFTGPVLSDDEDELLVAYRQLDPFDRGQALGVIRGLSLSSKYKKADTDALAG